MKKYNVKCRGNNIYMEEFKDIHEFADKIQERNKPEFEHSWSHGSGCITEKDKLQLLSGWSDMAQSISKDFNRINNVVTKEQKLKQKQYAIKGYYPNVGKALRGNIRCMGKYNKIKVPSKIVEIMLDVGLSCNRTQEELKDHSVEVLKKIRQLELMGFRVRLTAFQLYADKNLSNDGWGIKVTIKEENQPLDLARIAYPTCSEYMLRHWMFNWYEHLECARELSGYGVPPYHWNRDVRDDVCKALSITGSMYYVTFRTDMDEMFKPLLGGGRK